MTTKAQTRAAVAAVSKAEGDWIAAMVLKLVTQLTLAQQRRRYVAVTAPESTGTGYLPPDVKEYVTKASAA